MKTLAIGCDHAGYEYKEALRKSLEEEGYTVLNFGTDSPASVDYPDFVHPVCRAIEIGEADQGILICGSGVGAAVAVNKLKGIRAALCGDTYSAHQSREHDDCNVLCLGARVTGEELALELVRAFVAARFSGEERHRRRLAKVLEMEESG